MHYNPNIHNILLPYSIGGVSYAKKKKLSDKIDNIFDKVDKLELEAFREIDDAPRHVLEEILGKLVSKGENVDLLFKQIKQYKQSYPNIEMLNIKFKLNRVENMVDESIYRLNDKINVIESDEND